MFFMENPFRDFEAKLFEIKTGRYLTTMFTSTREEGEPYQIGEELTFSDGMLYQNNSKRYRKCYVCKIEHLSDASEESAGKYNLYIEATKEEVRFKKRSDFLRRDDSPDGDGYDGWLKPSL